LGILDCRLEIEKLGFQFIDLGKKEPLYNGHEHAKDFLHFNQICPWKFCHFRSY